MAENRTLYFDVELRSRPELVPGAEFVEDSSLQTTFEQEMRGYGDLYAVNTSDLVDRFGLLYDDEQSGRLYDMATEIGIDTDMLAQAFRGDQPALFMLPEQPGPLSTVFIDLNGTPTDLKRTIDAINEARRQLGDSGFTSRAVGATSRHYTVTRGASSHAYVHLLNPNASFLAKAPVQEPRAQIHAFLSKQRMSDYSHRNVSYDQVTIPDANIGTAEQVLQEVERMFSKVSPDVNDFHRRRYAFAQAANRLRTDLREAAAFAGGGDIDFTRYMTNLNNLLLARLSNGTWEFDEEIEDDIVKTFLSRGIADPARFFGWIQNEYVGPLNDTISIRRVYRDEGGRVSGYQRLNLHGVDHDAQDAYFVARRGNEAVEAADEVHSFRQMVEQGDELVGIRFLNYFVTQSGLVRPLVKLEDAVAPWADHVQLGQAMGRLAERHGSQRRIMLAPYAGARPFLDSMDYYRQSGGSSKAVTEWYSGQEKAAAKLNRTTLEFYM